MTASSNDKIAPAHDLDAITQAWFRQLRPSKLFIFTLLAVSLSSGMAVWISITGWDTNFAATSKRMLSVLVLVNLVFVTIVAIIIIRRLIGLYRGMRHGAAGSRLQRRIVGIFSLVTITPTIIVSLFSAIFFQFGVQRWFDARVKTAIEESVAVAEAYLEEHKATILADTLAMANDVKAETPMILLSAHSLNQFLNTQAALRNLTDAVIFTPQRVIARTELSFSLAFERLPQHVIEQADNGQVVLLADDGDDKIRALIKLDHVNNLYLLVGRVVDGKVLNHMVVAQGAANDYRRLQADISDIQLQFSLLFILIALMLLLAAVWYGVYVAMRLVIPITQLITAAEKVRAGDLSSHVPVTSKNDEISQLARTFNRMTEQLQKQRSELIDANRQLDERRHMMEAVFAGVSAGVVALDENGIITLHNKSAGALLADDAEIDLRGTAIHKLLPDISSLLNSAASDLGSLADQTLQRPRASGGTLILHVRIVAEHKDVELTGYILTCDDMTELVSAQRSAAWSDVARRIAHEIKNPLTPISLSAERLRKKYKPHLASEEDREAFQRYIDTISKHVKDIGQMVEEFSSFARMPASVMADHDMNRTVREAVFSARTAHPQNKFNAELPSQPVILNFDERQIAQALTNLFKNASEGLDPLREQNSDYAALITIRLEDDGEEVRLIIEDNGPGFPVDKLASLTEPYVTTRAKGTGLGLAIVKKHMEAHKGSILLENRDEGGARVILCFPR